MNAPVRTSALSRRRGGFAFALLVLLSGLTACGTPGGSSSAEPRAYEVIGDAHTLEQALERVELRRRVALAVDGLPADHPEVVALSLQLDRLGRLWADEAHRALDEERARLVASGFGPRSELVVAIDARRADVGARVARFAVLGDDD